MTDQLKERRDALLQAKMVVQIARGGVWHMRFTQNPTKTFCGRQINEILHIERQYKDQLAKPRCKSCDHAWLSWDNLSYEIHQEAEAQLYQEHIEKATGEILNLSDIEFKEALSIAEWEDKQSVLEFNASVKQRLADCLNACSGVTFKGEVRGLVTDLVQALNKLYELTYSPPATPEAQKHFQRIYRDAIEKVEIAALL